ncbi:hypothetical protein CLOSCI_02644 [[Clostridium] scindens ATCC 35704]|nr:hypothetical protein CLOSCI_02644 [[Clostridium] scindens ATCC 35704]
MENLDKSFFQYFTIFYNFVQFVHSPDKVFNHGKVPGFFLGLFFS